MIAPIPGVEPTYSEAQIEALIACRDLLAAQLDQAREIAGKYEDRYFSALSERDALSKELAQERPLRARAEGRALRVFMALKMVLTSADGAWDNASEVIKSVEAGE